MISGAIIAEKVLTARRDLGFTQSELATLASVSRPTIARIEAGEGDRVSVGTLVRVLRAVGRDLVIEKGVAMTGPSLNVEEYLDSLFGDAR